MLQPCITAGAAVLRVGTDFLFPQRCLGCGTYLDSTSLTGRHGMNACADCRSALAPEIPWSCERCAAAVGPHATTDDGCRHCRGKTLRFKTVTCLGMYEDALKRAVLHSKWAFSSVGMKSLGRLLGNERRDRLARLEVDCVLPIPQSWQNRIFRHFNPSHAIATELGRTLNVSAEFNVLVRCRNPRPQKRVPVSRRFENQQDSFLLRDPGAVTGARVLLVDDVLTTGATCSEATRLLKQHGAKRVDVAVLARVLDHSA